MVGRKPDPVDPDAPAADLALALRRIGSARGLATTPLVRKIWGQGHDRILQRASEGQAPLNDAQLSEFLAWPELSDRERLDVRFANIRARIAVNAERPPLRNFPVLDLVGIGAMNYDHVIPLEAYWTSHPESKEEFQVEVFTSEPEVRLTSNENVLKVLEHYKSELPQEHLGLLRHARGGSAFNVMQLVGGSHIGCRTGFIGVSGIVPDDIAEHVTLPHRKVLDDMDVDVQFVEPIPDEYGGRCVSAVKPYGDKEARREMHTWPGANTAMYDHLVKNFWDVVAYCASAKAIHVTSLFDDDSPRVLAEILEQALMCNPELDIFFDPGHDWAGTVRPYVARILALSSGLFVNTPELWSIASKYCEVDVSRDDERGQAFRLFDVMRKSRRAVVIVVKHTGSTAVYFAGLNSGSPFSLPSLAREDIQDDTGAGDAFAAAYLAARLSPVVQSHAGAYVGMELARAKLQRVGPPMPHELVDAINELGLPKYGIATSG